MREEAGLLWTCPPSGGDITHPWCERKHKEGGDEKVDGVRAKL